VRLALATFILAACGSSGRPDGALPDLSGSLVAARTEFNAHVHEARFLTLLSPT
jgi:hypothetical protein